MFCHFVGLSLCSNIPLCCLILYILIYSPLHFSQITLWCFWLLFTIGHMMNVIIMGALVNSAVSILMFLAVPNFEKNVKGHKGL